MRGSSSGLRRQLSNCFAEACGYDKNCRHLGSDARDSPLLLEVDGVTGEGDVVIEGEQGDQAEGKAADGLKASEPIKAQAVECQGPPTGLEAWGR